VPEVVFRIKQRFTILDTWKVQYKIADVTYSGLPAWVDEFVPTVPGLDIRYALDRYSDPLLSRYRYTPDQCLDRVPTETRTCASRKGCFGWDPKKCLDLKRNPCEVLVLPGSSEEEAKELLQLVNLWREKYYVARTETDL